MRVATLIAATVAVFAAAASPAAAVPPVHDSFSCQFVRGHRNVRIPGGLETVFTNDITSFSDADGTPTMLQLHQSEAGTWTAKGVALKVNLRETFLVEFDNGIPVIAKHIGLLNSVVGPNGPVFLRTGQRVFQVVFDPASGFYVDGPLIAAHGVRASFDPAAVCAAFG